MDDIIFTPFRLGAHMLRNRIVMPPMVTYHFGVRDGIPSEELARHYEARAAGGVAMILVEACCVEAGGRLAEAQLGLWSDAQLEGHRRIADGVHGYGIPVLAQLHHAGPRSVTGQPVGPTGGHRIIRGTAYDVKELSPEEIGQIREAFLTSALRAKACGYDGVEIHCCHSYLLCAFLSPLANQRTDCYGGDAERRLRLPLEILQDIRQACGPEFLISVRMGFDEPDLDAAAANAQAFHACGADLLHISTGFGSSGVMDEAQLPPAPDHSGFNIRVWAAGQLREQVSCPILAVGGIRQPRQAEQALYEGRADLVAVGRGLLCDPDWVNSAREGKPIAVCRNCKTCLWGKRVEACPGRRRTIC